MPGASRPTLRGESLSLVETIGQSIVNIAPTGTPALSVAVVAATASVGSWLAYLIATIGMILVAANIATAGLPRRLPADGGRRPLNLYRAGGMRVRHLVVGGVGVLLMAFMIFGSIYPVPEHPYDLLPYAFGAYLLVGCLWWRILTVRAPRAAAALRHDFKL
jgi:amino acid transporter